MGTLWHAATTTACDDAKALWLWQQQPKSTNRREMKYKNLIIFPNIISARSFAHIFSIEWSALVASTSPTIYLHFSVNFKR